jgi:tRNA1Val (adenine37-N6)-methyltransferase
MAADIFKFKQFHVDQSGCAMKVNTDGVLLGALAQANNPQRILDIGTGTGVIALMLAQRFINAHIDAVEIDEHAAKTAGKNFKESVFTGRLNIVHGDFATVTPSEKYDLIISNPPFFLDSLTSANEKMNLAKHTDGSFFDRLIKLAADYLTENGICQLIAPLLTVALIKRLLRSHELHLQDVVAIKSFTASLPHRQIITFGREERQLTINDFIIYSTSKVYTPKYQIALADFLTIF